MTTQTKVKTDEPAKAVVATISGHYSRQATPAVWAEVDELRERVAKLEALVSALRGE